MSTVELSAEVRDGRGKGPSRRLRKEGKLPGVVYFKGSAATSVMMEPKAFVKALMGPLRRNQLIELKLGSDMKTVMVRDIQIDPIRRNPTHVDFWQVDPQVPVVVSVPLRTTGKSKAVVLGAKLDIVTRNVRVRVLPGSVPEKIEVDVTDLEQGAFRAKDLPMPEGCALAEAEHLTVLTVSRPRADRDEAVEGAAPAAPAAGAKAAG